MNTTTQKQSSLKTRWIIQGTLTTKTALHIGSGASELDGRLAHDPEVANSEQAMASLVVRDYKGKPYLPGSAIKGVLRHYAEAFGAQDIQTIFGERGEQGVSHSNQFAGLVDFLPAQLNSAPDNQANPKNGMAHYSHDEATGLIAAHARERTTKAVAAQKLFHYEAVPAGAKFNVVLHAEGLEEQAVSELLGLLQGFSGKAESLSLGAKQATGLGVMQWKKTCVKRLTEQGAREWWKKSREGYTGNGATITPWQEFAEDRNVIAAPQVPAANRSPLTLVATIAIDGPFLVNEPAHKGSNSNEPDHMPRRTQDGKIELPGSSLHGALRAQAERICRTLGLEVLEGHEAPAYKSEKTNLDIVSWLFGAPGWRSVLRVESFTAPDPTTTDPAPTTTLLVQDFVALDRFHGGVSGSAKFNAQYVLNPTLSGAIGVDLRRLGISKNQKAALGLLALTLRDLDEGDIPLGYGAAAKGYGQVDTVKTQTLNALAGELKKHNIALDDAVNAFRDYCKSKSKVGTLPAAQTQPMTASTTNPVGPLQIQAPAQGDFHNPYAFLPVDKPKDKDKWKHRSDSKAQNLGHHSHDRYALKDANGNPVYSGRIICHLENKTPLFIGGHDRTGTSPTTISPFRLGGDIALPATSLRGMIGAIIEAASQSSMRVLDNKTLSMRMQANENRLPKKGVEKAISRLYTLSDERTEASTGSTKTLPKVCGQRNPDSQKYQNRARLTDGQTVYFLSKNSSIVEIAYSQIWRSRIEDSQSETYDIHQFFKAIDAELLPLNSERKQISPAEWLLGFVSTDKQDPQAKKTAGVSAFAGKLRVSFGLATEARISEEAVKLKILASPKPPSPAMYFKPKNGAGAYVSKPNLASNPQGYSPNGRKVYLHALREGDAPKGLNDTGLPENLTQSNEPWRSRNPNNDNQKVQVTPIDSGAKFWFHIDFDNIDQSELELLCFALHPCDKFEHRLGMGRSLGLGSVSVTPEALLLIDRAARYGVNVCGSGAHRYHAVWQNQVPRTNDMHTRYSAALSASSVAGYITPTTVSELAQAGAAKVKELSEALWRAIVLTGHPDAINKPVHTPQVAGKNVEEKTYQWFVENDKAADIDKQFVAPKDDEVDGAIKPIKRHPAPQ